MSNVDAHHLTNQLISIFQTVKQTYERNENDIAFYNQEYTDITHALELLHFNAAQGYRLAKQLKANRANRRLAKDQNQQLQPLYELLTRNQGFLKELRKVQSQIERIKSDQQNRLYTVRARTDMQAAFDRAKEKQGAVQSG